MSLPPVRREVVVACDPATAFRLWTEQIGTWWPVASHSCFGDAHVAFEGDVIVETGPSGDRAEWGTVTTRREPDLLAFTWHPGYEAAHATTVTVTFTSIADGTTLVTLVHEGWEAMVDPTAARASYADGWVTVLGCLAAAPAGARPPA